VTKLVVGLVSFCVYHFPEPPPPTPLLSVSPLSKRNYHLPIPRQVIKIFNIEFTGLKC